MLQMSSAIPALSRN